MFLGKIAVIFFQISSDEILAKLNIDYSKGQICIVLNTNDLNLENEIKIIPPNNCYSDTAYHRLL